MSRLDAMQMNDKNLKRVVILKPCDTHTHTEGQTKWE